MFSMLRFMRSLVYVSMAMIFTLICTEDVGSINLFAPELFFLILAHPVYKMWIIQEPNALELWNKLHFE